MNKKAVVALSGGMDSTCLLIKLLAEGYDVYGVSFDYGQKHDLELRKLEQNIKYLTLMEKPLKMWWKLDLKMLGRMFNSSLLKSSQEAIPEGHYEQENMKSTVVPNRNAIFSSIIYGYALSIAEKENCEVEICLGVHSGDHAIYPDCTPQFYHKIKEAFDEGNWGSEKVKYFLPYINGNKTSILEEALVNCEKLGFEFDTVLRNTNTSYNPTPMGEASGTSGSDIERIEAFLNIGRKDPVSYEGGWEKAKAHALKVLNREE